MTKLKTFTNLKNLYVTKITYRITLLQTSNLEDLCVNKIK